MIKSKKSLIFGLVAIFCFVIFVVFCKNNEQTKENELAATLRKKTVISTMQEETTTTTELTEAQEKLVALGFSATKTHALISKTGGQR